MCQPEKSDKHALSDRGDHRVGTAPPKLPHRRYLMFVVKTGLGPPGFGYKYGGGSGRP
jgi:hypothetical protein